MKKGVNYISPGFSDRGVAKNLGLSKSSITSYRHRLGIAPNHSSGLPFDLDWKYLARVFDFQGGMCFYMEIPLSIIRGAGHTNKNLSVDKIEPKKGYVRGNVVFCTKRANLVKNDLTLEELKRWIPLWYEKIIRWKSESEKLA